MAKLPSTTSIVDFLNSQGKDSSFGARRNLFNESGLDKRLGSFVGSASQNLNLLKSLQTPTTKQSSPSFFKGQAPPNAQEAKRTAASDTLKQFSISNSPNKDVFGTAVMRPFQDALDFGTQTSTPAVAPQGGDGGFNIQDIIDKATTEFSPTEGIRVNEGRGRQSVAPESVQDTVDRFTQPDAGQSKISSSELLKQFSINAGKASQASGGGAAPDTPQNGTTVSTQQSKERDTQTRSNIGFSASDILGSQSNRSESDLVNDYLSSSEGKLLLEKQELANLTAQGKADAAKQALESKFASDKEGLENRLASNGLAFSGIRGTQVKALSDSLASSMLGVDRKLATMLLEGDIKFRETVLDGVSDLISAASKDDKDAIAQLNKAGYAVIGDQLVPTLARENATIDDIRSDANLAISQRRLELAEQTNARAASKLAKGDSGKESDFAVFLSLLSDIDNETSTESEFLLWGLQNTDLTKSELQSAIATKPKSSEALTQEAAKLVSDEFDSPGFFKRLLPGNDRNRALVKAKKAAIKALVGLDFATSAERESLKESISSLTVDDLQ